jgi:hypothetical protein
MHNLPQFGMLRAGRGSADGRDYLHFGIQKAFAQNTLAYHAGRAE